MNQFRMFTSLALVVMLAFSVAACGKTADTSKPIDQVRAEAEKMSLKDLEAEAKAYAAAVQAKRADIEKIAAELKTLSIQEMMGEKGKSIKDRMASVSSEINALTERYQAYAKKYQELGGNIDSIKLS